MIKHNIDFSRPSIGEEEINEVVACLKSGWITTGPKVQIFEKQFARYAGCKYALALSSGTAALHLAMMASGIGPGDEVITTPMTFVATINMIDLLGAKPVFTDIEADTLNIDVSLIEEKITSRTKAIVPVHFAGLPCKMDKIWEIAKRRKLLVLEDAAHAIGTLYNGEKIGCRGQACFSFHPIKNITTGEGGMFTTNDEETAKKVSLLRFHGINKSAWDRYSKDGTPFYDVLFPGYKFNMMDIQASLGIHQLNKLDEFIQRRTEIACLYKKLLSENENVILPADEPAGCRHAWHLFIVRFKAEKLKKSRNDIVRELKKQGISTGLHFLAVHTHKYYQEKYGYKLGDFPNAEYASERVVSLPLFPELKNEEVEMVCSAIKEIIA